MTQYKKTETTLVADTEMVVGNSSYVLHEGVRTVGVRLENIDGTVDDPLTLFQVETQVTESDDWIPHLSTATTDDFAIAAAASTNAVTKLQVLDASNASIATSIGELEAGDHATLSMTFEGVYAIRFIAKAADVTTVRISVNTD